MEIDKLSLKHLSTPTVRDNPYSFYAQLREQDPVHWDEQMGFWVLTGYQDIVDVYASTQFSRAQGLMHNFERLTPEEKQIAAPVYDSFAQTLMYTDPPTHGRLRGLMNPPFMPRHVQYMNDGIIAIINELLDHAQEKESVDLIHDLAYPLPVLVIAEMIGLPKADWKQFKDWSDDLFAVLGTMQHSKELLTQAASSLKEMSAYITKISQNNPNNSVRSLIGYMTDKTKNAAEISNDELISNISVLLGAGHETTSNLIGTGLLALIQHPEQFEQLRNNPALIDNAVEELLRYDSPVQIAYRAAITDVEVGGKIIKKGQIVNLILGAGNRDPEQYATPNQFDIHRKVGRHLAFGLGIHFCLGAHLVRLEARLAIEALLKRYKHFELETTQFEWQSQPIFRGLKSLPVKFR